MYTAGKTGNPQTGLLAFIQSALLLLVVLGIGGCSLSPPAAQQRGQANPLMQKRLHALKNWDIDGKLAVRTNHDSQSARLQWQQTGERFDIHLSGPAGLHASRIYGEPGDVVFERGEQKEHATTAAALSEKLIGWPLPTVELRYWLRGLPAPNLTVTQAAYLPNGNLTQLQQNGWSIQFSAYQHFENKERGVLLLPGRIEAKHGNMRIILLIKHWNGLE